MASRLKKGDDVFVISGSAKGERGRIVSVDVRRQRVYVEGVNLCVRHTKPSMQNPDGGLVRKEASIHVSNVALVDPGSPNPSAAWSAKQATKVGFRWVDGVKMRYAKRSDHTIGPV